MNDDSELSGRVAHPDVHVDQVTAFARTLHELTPWVVVTPGLIVANVVVFIVMVASGVSPLNPPARVLGDWGANFGPLTMNGEWWRLLTSMFLHSGIVHLALNMVFLWYIGRLVERLVGNVGFLVLYLVSGIAGSIASLAWHPELFSVGASGAIFGVAGALLGFVILRRDSIPDTIFRQLRHSVVALIGYNLVFGMMVPAIDMAAHGGGLIAGLICGLILSQRLAPGIAPRRWIRNLAVVLAGAVTLPLAMASLPEAPPDVELELQRFIGVERLAIETMNNLVKQMQRKEIDEQEFADAVEDNVLPPWVEARRGMEKLLDERGVDRNLLARLADYMKLREESWRLLAEGVREQDSDKIELSSSKQKAADKMAKEISTQ